MFKLDGGASGGGGDNSLCWPDVLVSFDTTLYVSYLSSCTSYGTISKLYNEGVVDLYRAYNSI